MILVDTSGLLAALFQDQRRHQECAQILLEDEGPFLLSPFVLAELDYLIAKLAGAKAQAAFLAEVADESYRLEALTASDIAEAREVIVSHSDLNISLADASIVVLARRHRLHRLLTLDERHFRVLPGSEGASFQLLPADR